MQQTFQFNKRTSRDEILEDLFAAYFDARKNKRNTINALAFERNFEVKIFHLFDEIMTRSYKPKPGICFIVDKPVKREIFAADFRDRVIHHFIYNYIYPVFEKVLIWDTYSCRKGKGVHYGIKRANHFIRSCSQNYKKDCYILKLDIKSYFMSMRRDILYKIVEKELIARKEKIGFDLPLVLYLVKETIFNDPTVNCVIKGTRKDWEGLPPSKSLFNAKHCCGLPIGNLTSQLFGNTYLNDFDHFIKRNLKLKYYGRYVDDLIIINEDSNYLKKVIPEIRNYLKRELHLELHPNKIFLQHFSKGVKYLGAVIKPYRIYISNETKGNFYSFLNKHRREAGIILNTEEEKKHKFQSTVNSYLGIMSHFSTFRIRRKIIQSFLANQNSFCVSSEFLRIIKNQAKDTSH